MIFLDNFLKLRRLRQIVKKTFFFICFLYSFSKTNWFFLTTWRFLVFGTYFLEKILLLDNFNKLLFSANFSRIISKFWNRLILVLLFRKNWFFLTILRSSRNLSKLSRKKLKNVIFTILSRFLKFYWTNWSIHQQEKIFLDNLVKLWLVWKNCQEKFNIFFSLVFSTNYREKLIFLDILMKYGSSTKLSPVEQNIFFNIRHFVKIHIFVFVYIFLFII